MDLFKSEFGADMPMRLRLREANVCNYSEFVKNEGIKEGIKEGKAESLLSLMKNLKLSLDQALNLLCIPESEIEDYRKLVHKLEG